RELDGGVATCGVRVDLDGEQVVAAMQVARGDGERLVLGAVHVGGEGVGVGIGLEAAARELDAVQPGGKAVGVTDAERERLQRRQLAADREVPARETRAGTRGYAAVGHHRRRRAGRLRLVRRTAVAPLDERAA